MLKERAYGTLRNETKRNEMVLCETVLCEMVLCEMGRKVPEGELNGDEVM